MLREMRNRIGGGTARSERRNIGTENFWRRTLAAAMLLGTRWHSVVIQDAYRTGGK